MSPTYVGAFLLLVLLQPSAMESTAKDQGSVENYKSNMTSSVVGPRTAVDLQTEERLRERWNLFMSERTKQLAFVDDLSSPEEVHVVAGKDLYLSCGFNRPLNGRLKISFMRLKDFQLLSVRGEKGAGFSGHGGTGVVAHLLVLSREGVEQSGFASVGISNQGDFRRGG